VRRGLWRLPENLGSWPLAENLGLLLLLLLGCVLIELRGLPPPDDDTRDNGTAGPPPVTRTVTLAIQRDIDSMLDRFAPFLRADTPLLSADNPLLRRQCHTEVQPHTRLWVSGAVAAKVKAVCDQAPLSFDNEASLKEACRHLNEDLVIAFKAHMRVAQSLAGPNRRGLWLHRIDVGLTVDHMLLDRIIGAVPRRLTVTIPSSDDNGPHRATPMTDGEAANDWMTAHLFRHSVQFHLSKEPVKHKIRKTLLKLRANCVHITASIRLISNYSSPELNRASGLAELAPLAGPVEQLVPAIDDLLASVDAADDVLQGLLWWLERMPRGYFEIDEVVGEEVVRTRFELPPAVVISQSLDKRRKRLRNDFSALQDQVADAACGAPGARAHRPRPVGFLGADDP
jgi:hypothetical protein